MLLHAKLSFLHTLFLENEGQIDQSNYGTMCFMSKQVSLWKISSILQKNENRPKTYIHVRPFCTKAFKLIVLKVSFVVHSTIHLQKMPLGKLRVFCILYFSKTKCKPAKKITGQCFSTEVKDTCTHSANLEQETEVTKIVTYPPFPLASSYTL